MIFELAYIICGLISFRYITGWFLNEFAPSYRSADGLELSCSLLLGVMCATVWPIFAIVRTIYVLYTKYGADNINFITSLFPAPKEVETRRERAVRKEKEREAKQRQKQTYINSLERKLEIEPTRW